MKKYCFDTSGISTPAEHMPQDIHQSMWRKIIEIIQSGSVAVTTEIYDEMIHIPGDVGACIVGSKPLLVLEVNEDGWDWETYVAHSARMSETYRQYIYQYGNDSPRSVSVNDMTIVALAKTLDLPCVSMETRSPQSPVKRKIPDICDMEGVEHLTFNDFLRREGITL